MQHHVRALLDSPGWSHCIASWLVIYAVTRHVRASLATER
jgi:hypothetical protein